MDKASEETRDTGFHQREEEMKKREITRGEYSIESPTRYDIESDKNNSDCTRS